MALYYQNDVFEKSAVFIRQNLKLLWTITIKKKSRIETDHTNKSHFRNFFCQRAILGAIMLFINTKDEGFFHMK
jgi:hypothetical protein